MYFCDDNHRTGDEHATICESCDRPACRGCFLNGEICKECGFQCNACHETIRHSDQDDHDRPFVCHGQSAIENSTPCPFGKGQGLTCWECEPGNARRCGQDGCYRMECGECNVIRVCGGCQEWCCIFCDERARRNHKDFFLLQSCVTCNFSLCYGCDMNGHHPHQEIFTCEEVRGPHSFPPFNLSIFHILSFSFSPYLSSSNLSLSAPSVK